jgi:hypothetical protein
MRRLAFLPLAVLALSIAGCKPEAAIQNGTAVSRGKDASQKADTPNVIEPSTEKQPPLKKVQ